MGNLNCGLDDKEDTAGVRDWNLTGPPLMASTLRKTIMISLGSHIVHSRAGRIKSLISFVSSYKINFPIQK